MGRARSARRAREHYFDPRRFGNLEGWWDARWVNAYPANPPVEGFPIGTFIDLSGKARHLSQATAGLKPLYRVSAFNGNPCLDFDGVNDVVSMAIANTLLAMPHRTVYFVGQLTAVPTGTGGIFTAGGSEWYHSVAVNSRMHGSIRDATAVQRTLVGVAGSELTTPSVATWTSDVPALGDTAQSVTRNYYRNGVNVGTSVTNNGESTTTGTVLTIGGLTAAGGSPSPVRVAAILFYSATHDDLTRRRIERALGTLWGVAVA